MLTYERERESVRNQQVPGGGSGVEDLANLREEGEALFQAGDDAINRALAGDSLAFLRATRQEGGQ
jgi:hypothetical protein